jgi:hypothetical protein
MSETQQSELREAASRRDGLSPHLVELLPSLRDFIISQLCEEHIDKEQHIFSVVGYIEVCAHVYCLISCVESYSVVLFVVR